MPPNNPNAAANLRPFKKGDPRINRKGRPKSFDAARELAKEIAHEVAIKAGDQLVIEGHVVTVVEDIFRQWARSKDPRLQMAFMEYAFGKPPARTEVTGADGEPVNMVIRWGDADHD